MFDVLLGFVEYRNQVVDKDVGQLFCVYGGGQSECGVEEVKENWFVLKGGNIKGSISLHRDVCRSIFSITISKLFNTGEVTTPVRKSMKMIMIRQITRRKLFSSPTNLFPFTHHQHNRCLQRQSKLLTQLLSCLFRQLRNFHPDIPYIDHVRPCLLFIRINMQWW